MATFVSCGLMLGASGCFLFPEEELPEYGFSGAASAANLNESTIRISWTEAAGEAVQSYAVFEVATDGSLSQLASVAKGTLLYDHTGLTAGTYHTYLVRAVDENEFNDGNDNKVSAIAYAGISSASAVGKDGATITYPAASGASSLRVYCSVGGGAYSLLASPLVSSTSTDLTGLTAGAEYVCKVIAVTLSGAEDANTRTASFTLPDLTFSGASSATVVDSSKITVAWSAGTGSSISSYSIYRVLPDGSYSLVATVASTTTSYTVTGLTAGTLYTFVVRAFDASGNSDGNSLTVSAFPYAGITSGAATNQTTATVVFPAATEASAVRLYCKLGSGSYSLFASATSSATSASLTGLTAGGTYTCKANPVHVNGTEIETSAEASFTQPSLTFAGATSASVVDSSKITVSWTAGTGSSIASYSVYQVQDDGSYSLAASAASSRTSYTVTGLDSGSLYSFVVRAVDSNGNTDGNSNAVSAFTYTGITSASATGQTTATAVFPSATEASSIRIYCKIGSGSYSLITSATSSATSASLTGLTAGSTYTCKALPVDVNGTEYDSSATASFSLPDLTFAGATSISQPSTTSILVSWSAGSGASISGYKVYEVSTADNSTTLINTASSSTASYLHSGLTAGTYHKYLVRAVDANGITDSNTAYVSHLLYAGITSVTVTGSTTATVALSAATAATSLKLYCKTASGSYTLMSTLASTDTSASLTGLSTGSTYTCKVQPVTSDAVESTSAITASAYTPHTGVSSSSSLSYTSATLNYGSAEWASSYNLHCKDRTTSTYTVYGTGTSGSTSGSVTGLKSGMTYVCKVLAVHSTDGEQASSVTTTFQTTSYTSGNYNNVILVQAYGASSGAPSGPTAAQASITWAAFDSADTSTSYKLLRVGTGGTIDYDSTTACTNILTTTCQVCTATGTGAKTCTDTAAAASPQIYDYAVVQVVSSSAEELPSSGDSAYRIKVPIPPANMVLVHRASVNVEMCDLLGQSAQVDPLNYNRCPYTGLGNVPYNSNPGGAALNLSTSYYDFGYNLFIDRFEAGCNITYGTACAGGDCFGSADPSTGGGLAAAVGTVYFRYDTASPSAGYCFVKTASGDTAWTKMASLTSASDRALAYTISPSSTQRKPTMQHADQTTAYNVCQSSVDSDYGAKRLLRRREFVAAAAFQRLTGEPSLLTDSAIQTLEGGGNHTTAYRCNSNATTNDVTPGSTFNGSEEFSNPVNGTAPTRYSFVIGSTKTSSCVSRFGAQDMVGNVSEWTSESGTTTGASAYSVDFTAPSSTLDSGNTTMDGFGFNGTQGYGGVSLATYQYHGTAGSYVSVPLGFPMSGSDSGQAIANATFTPTRAHGDAIFLNTSTAASPGIHNGGHFNAGDTAGRFGGHLNAAKSSQSHTIGFRCAVPAE